MNMESLIRLSSVKRYAKGAILAQQGDATGELFFLLQGKVDAVNGYGTTTQTQAASYGSGSFFGELPLFLGQPQPATYVALTGTVALALNRQNINEFFRSQPELTLLFVEGICRKLDASQDECRRMQSILGETDEQPAGKQAVPQKSQDSELFPQGHGSYLLEMDNKSRECLYEQDRSCPLCNKGFKNLTVLTSRMKPDRTGPDLRTHYKGIEPLYYDVVTCPDCFYSALTDAFDAVSPNLAQRVYEEIEPYQSQLASAVKSNVERDSFTVFAGYYLALICAPVCLDDYQMTAANLWLKLSRIYQDVADEAMVLYAAGKALAEYKYAYQNFNVSEKISQQLCYLMGDLEYRLGDVAAAQTHFFMAKGNREGTATLSRQADLRLEEIRESTKEE